MRLPTGCLSLVRDFGEGSRVLAFEDCLGAVRLGEGKVAIAEHEHLPEIVALELGNFLLRGPDGELW